MSTWRRADDDLKNLENDNNHELEDRHLCSSATLAEDEFQFQDTRNEDCYQPPLKSLDLLWSKETQRLQQCPFSLVAVAEEGRFGDMRELLKELPVSAMEKTPRGNTALHLAAMNCILETIRAIINSQEVGGNTTLHLASSRKQLQILRLLEEESPNYDGLGEVNAKNHGGFTALDISDLLPEDGYTNRSLNRAGGLRGRDKAEQKHQPLPLQAIRMRSLKSSCDAVLVTATLLAMITFQLVLRPPEGFIQTYQSKTEEKNEVMMNHLFFLFNSVSFFTSLAVINILMQDLPFKLGLHILMLSSIGAFICGIIANSPQDLVMVLWIATIVSICLASHTMLSKYIKAAYTRVSSVLNNVC
ncbi:hypothetical protein K2173_027514 [Erythroxylum novogranatense]|uniref:PGG domain-containing protein n=1 Tax=Erythroxylum novogranatense TaxID=1862640 RepID=A0AAV8TZF4_9ROSI|nr:hypothetical protein K2173_027514 [Erythroxylum novogranatense]